MNIHDAVKHMNIGAAVTRTKWRVLPGPAVLRFIKDEGVGVVFWFSSIDCMTYSHHYVLHQNDLIAEDWELL